MEQCLGSPDSAGSSTKTSSDLGLPDLVRPGCHPKSGIVDCPPPAGRILGFWVIHRGSEFPEKLFLEILNRGTDVDRRVAETFTKHRLGTELLNASGRRPSIDADAPKIYRHSTYEAVTQNGASGRC